MATAAIPKIELTKRTKLGKTATLADRRAGKMPVVIYGHKVDPVHACADAKAMTEMLHHHAHLVEASVDGAVEPCLIKDVQWDHLGSKIIHVDMARVDLNEKVTVTVEIKFVGEPKGAKAAGAFISHPVSELEVNCLATNIPEEILVDVSNLGVDETLTAGEIKLPEGVELESDPELIVAAVEIAQEEVEPEAAADAPAEPELIRKPAATDEAPADEKKK
ncbi:MAG: 50S ribosomal protein L25 [Phycisphaera sp.]|nr:50S ribosomal protein L25 [Phycisphaera sp.]